MMPTIVAVIGVPRSGTSCVAGVLHHLGVSMGRDFQSPNRHNPRGFFEGLRLAQICQASYRQPLLVPRNGRQERVAQLARWFARRQQRERNADRPLGAKFAMLCLLVEELAEAWPGLAVVATERPLSESLASMDQIPYWRRFSPDQRQTSLEQMLARRDADLARLQVPTLRLPFAQVIRDPTGTIDALAELGGFAPSAAERAAALAFVDPSLKHQHQS